MASNGLEIGNKYKITGIIACAKDGKYIPYIAGCTLVGPKGKDYMLDTFGLEMLARYCKFTYWLDAREGHVSVRGEMISTPIIYGNYILSFENKLKTNEDIIKAFAKNKGVQFIPRTKVKEFVAKVSNK